MASSASPAIVTVLRSRLRPEAAALGYHELAERMEHRARAIPGLLDFKTFTADGGERVSIVVFDNIDHHNRWREDPEHRAARSLTSSNKRSSRERAASTWWRVLVLLFAGGTGQVGGGNSPSTPRARR